MIVLNPNDTTHFFNFIPRTNHGDVVLSLYNETTQESETIINTSAIINGITTISFEKTFVENDKFQIKITQEDEVIFRGKLLVTSQEPQAFKATKDLYYYE
jgi:hypothetical protein